METINQLQELNYAYLLFGFIVILAAWKFIASLWESTIGKLGIETKGMREKREEHELLIQTSKNLAELQEKHKVDVEQSIAHDKKIQSELSEFMTEMKESICQTQTEIKQFADNRIHDREQSFKIQKELTDAIKTVANGEKDRDKQIEALMCGNKELLGAEIDKRYREYISLGGIPESDVDEFDDIFSVYKKLNGNHRRDTKYNYVKNHLRVIPIETKLVTNNESK